jgi:hypothetical protein
VHFLKRNKILGKKLIVTSQLKLKLIEINLKKKRKKRGKKILELKQITHYNNP